MSKPPKIPEGWIDVAEEILPELDAQPSHLVWRDGAWVDQPKARRLSKADRKLVNEYTRVHVGADAIVLEVCVFEWRPRHCMPVMEWYEARRLPIDAKPRAVARARRALLGDPRWFATCGRCGARQPRGYAFGDRCNACPSEGPPAR